MTDTLASSYDPTQFESRLYQQWESSGVFQPRGEGEPYSILLPPPNVTGTLHMGHASISVCWNAWPMCRVPVTFGGGSRIE